ncbi:hypothetical protein SLEP1_g55382 [Rubroshorea leprosula]|uniref:Uncharacterized protein n=1 Tax=Rubroshorea leprosula TaxID=152421 RepID=A0AAV5MJE5_9ROSI|nr:hypothetical protein SLEP1_g55382 [Rubroshorea leprosula]
MYRTKILSGFGLGVFKFLSKEIFLLKDVPAMKVELLFVIDRTCFIKSLIESLPPALLLGFKEAEVQWVDSNLRELGSPIFNEIVRPEFR